MASSRIFVRGLPPTFTEEELRKHFSTQYATTDVKLFPHRRIGYVGYKTPEDAVKAVKYFNKSFIRMSRIGVEIARPAVGQTSLKSSRGGSKPLTIQPSTNSNNVLSDDAQQNPLKRKRPGSPQKEADPKLKEFLEVMQPPSKSNIWTSETVSANEDTSAPSIAVVELENANDSDDEYQVVTKKSRPTETHIIPSTLVSEPADNPSNEEQADVTMAMEEAEHAQQSGEPISDMDWFRSRTNRTLDLDLDEVDKDLVAPTSEGPKLPPPSPGEGDARPEAPADDNTDEAKDQSQEDSNESTIFSNGRLFLRNLPYNVTEDEIRTNFSGFGTVEEVHVPIDSHTGAGKGFAYVLFADPAHALEAFRQLDGSIFQGRLLHVLPAAAKRESTIDDFSLSKLPLKKQKQLQKKADATKATFSWNSLYMNANAVMSSVAARLGVDKAQLLDPTSSDAAVKQAHAETHIISETKAYFTQNGVDLDAFKRKERGDTAILVKNFPYGTTTDDLRKLFEEHGQLKRLLMPPSGTIAIIEYAQAPSARSAFKALAFRKIKDSILYLEKAPKDLFTNTTVLPVQEIKTSTANPDTIKPSANDLLEKGASDATVDTTTLFVRNLDFSTTTERLTETFGPIDGFLSARVKTKTDPKKPNQILSMGFGFLEFRTKAQAQAALAAMDGYNLDGHNLIIKASHKGLDAAEERRKEDQAKKAAAKKAKVVVKNLPFEATKKDVRALLSPYGQLKSVRVPKKFDHSTRGFAFAEFTTPREAENAMDALRNTHLLGRRLVLEFASEDPEDAEAEIERMQKKVGSQMNKVALQRLTGAGRKKFNVSGNDDIEDN